MKWLFLIFLLIGSCFVNAQNTLPKSKHSFVVIAHRGDHTEAPENTLQAYKNAIKNYVDYIEIDLRTTKDSQLVIMHDENLLRMTGVNEKVSNLTLDALKQLRVREKSHPEWGNIPFLLFLKF
jgi:glycerophosphoryl diester phosphodiesterase